MVKPQGAARPERPRAQERVDARRAKVRGRAGPGRPFYIALVAVAVVGGGAIWYASTRTGATTVATVDPTTPVGKAEGYLLGRPDAPVQVAEFADFECPACSQFATVTEPDVRKRLVETGLVAYRFFDFPLPMHRNTWFASNAAACADEQGKFWPMHDALFAHQDEWNGEATRNPKGKFADYARSIGLDVAKWEQCYDAQRHMPRIRANRAEAERRQVPSTPTFVIGDKMLIGAVAYDKFKAYVDSALAARPAGGAAPVTPAPTPGLTPTLTPGASGGTKR